METGARARVRLAGLLAIAAVVPFAAGCGGGSSASGAGGSTASDTSSTAGVSSRSSTTATQTDTTRSSSAAPAAKFIARADAICRGANAQLANSPKVASKRPAAIAAVIVKNEAIERKTVGELSKLKPPAELARAWAKVLGDRRLLANQLGDFAAGVRQGEKKFPALAASKKQLHAELHEVAGKAGFKDCASIG